MAWTIIEITKWQDFVEKIDSTKIHESTLPQWIFRGQSNNSWSLQPSLLRKLILHNINPSIAAGIEKQLYREFITKHRLFCNHEIPKYEKFYALNVFAMMQHYSCPTRLLDWTHSPFIALFFAVGSNFQSDGCVYLFNESLVDKSVGNRFKRFGDLEEEDLFGGHEINSIYAGITAFQTERNIFQQGLFTISPNIAADHERIIDEILTIEEKTGFHFKLIIPKELKIEFLARLRYMNISADVLYRSLDGLGQSLSNLIDIRGWKNQ